MDLLRDGLDVKLVEEGVWKYYLDDSDEDTKFKICRWNNVKYQAAMRKALSPHKQGMRASKLSDKKLADIERRVIAQTILVDWKNLASGGKEVPYSEDKAYEILSNPEHALIEEFVRVTALDEDNYRKEELNEAVGK